jgi:peptidoglycan/xylan/chitin deacetylase (PgdA/CDA1 family)
MDRLGLGGLALTHAWRGVVTLSYHRFATDSADPTSDAGAERLQAQMRLICAHCEVLGSDQLDERTLVEPGRRVVVTVDDCYRDSYELAFPVFAAHGVQATFFLTSGFLDGTAIPWWDEVAWMVNSSTRERLNPSRWWATALPLQGRAASATATELVRVRRGLDPKRGEEMLDDLAAATGSGRRPRERGEEFITWEHAREMAAAGMSLGGHTDTHPVLATLSEEGQRAEIERGLDRIATELGERPATFAYPVGLQGTFDSSTKAALAACGVSLAFSNYGGYTRRSNWDPLELRRVGVGPLTSEAALRWTVGLPAVFAREWRPGQFRLYPGD